MNERNLKGKICQIGKHQVLLPMDHKLDQYQRAWPRYDVVLGEVAIEVHNKYPSATVIDIGANVGDSVALINGKEDIPVLAIEGNAQFIPYLYENAARVGNHIEVFEGYVGSSAIKIDVSLVTTDGGTASLAAATDSGQTSVNLMSLSEIVAIKERFAESRLLKLDTDGFDFEIIVSSVEYLANWEPVIFFEYYIGFRAQDDQLSLKAISELMQIGYDRFMIWDNFGHFMITTEAHKTFVELNAFLRSNRKNGTAIYYLDVCAFHSRDRDLFNSLRNKECSR